MITQQTAIDYVTGGWRNSDKAKNEPAGGGLGIDSDGDYGFQCKDLLNDFAAKLNAPFPAGNAIVLQQGAPAGWSYVASPQAGDVALRDYVSQGVNYGDGVLVESVSGSSVTVLGQNQIDVSLTYGHVPTEATRPILTYKKFLRRNYDVAPATPAPTPESSFKMPVVGSSVQLIPTVTRTTYKPGTTVEAGHINVTNDQYIYVVRGYDPIYQGRVIINSASGGGDGIALALYYTNGVNIGNWKQY